MKNLLSISLLLLVFLCSSLSFGQSFRKKIKIIHANSFEFDDQIAKNAQRLIGNVQFEHENTMMRCDSAYLYSNNSFDAFGNVRIWQGDTLNLYCKTLNYNGNSKLAKLRDNITLRDDDITLLTNVLDYNTKTGIASYHEGGKMNSQESQNRLESTNGYYYTKDKLFHFKDDVILKNPKYTLVCDTLKYGTNSEIAYFLGPTEIKSRENLIYCENGWYDTQNERSSFNQNAYIFSKDQKLFGDSLYYDRAKGHGYVFNNIQLIDTTNNFIIYGNYGFYDENKNVSIVTDHAYFVQIFEDDSLYLNSDTLTAVELPDRSKNVRAYPNVIFFKSDLQGKCDSLVYSEQDSTILMFENPIVWSEENQITGDTIELLTYEGNFEELKVYKDVFVIQQDSMHFNQIKGKELKGLFKDNKPDKIYINGNGQVIYYAKDKQERLVGINKIDCSNILIQLKGQEIEEIKFLTQPEGVMLPSNDQSEQILDGFNLQFNNRPQKKEDVIPRS